MSRKDLIRVGVKKNETIQNMESSDDESEYLYPTPEKNQTPGPSKQTKQNRINKAVSDGKKRHIFSTDSGSDSDQNLYSKTDSPKKKLTKRRTHSRKKVKAYASSPYKSQLGSQISYTRKPRLLVINNEEEEVVTDDNDPDFVDIDTDDSEHLSKKHQREKPPDQIKTANVIMKLKDEIGPKVLHSFKRSSYSQIIQEVAEAELSENEDDIKNRVEQHAMSILESWKAIDALTYDQKEKINIKLNRTIQESIVIQQKNVSLQFGLSLRHSKEQRQVFNSILAEHPKCSRKEFKDCVRTADRLREEDGDLQIFKSITDINLQNICTRLKAERTEYINSIKHKNFTQLNMPMQHQPIEPIAGTSKAWSPTTTVAEFRSSSTVIAENWKTINNYTCSQKQLLQIENDPNIRSSLVNQIHSLMRPDSRRKTYSTEQEKTIIAYIVEHPTMNCHQIAKRIIQQDQDRSKIGEPLQFEDKTLNAIIGKVKTILTNNDEVISKAKQSRPDQCEEHVIISALIKHGDKENAYRMKTSDIAVCLQETYPMFKDQNMITVMKYISRHAGRSVFINCLSKNSEHQLVRHLCEDMERIGTDIKLFSEFRKSYKAKNHGINMTKTKNTCKLLDKAITDANIERNLLKPSKRLQNKIDENYDNNKPADVYVAVTLSGYFLLPNLIEEMQKEKIIPVYIGQNSTTKIAGCYPNKMSKHHITDDSFPTYRALKEGKRVIQIFYETHSNGNWIENGTMSRVREALLITYAQESQYNGTNKIGTNGVVICENALKVGGNFQRNECKGETANIEALAKKEGLFCLKKDCHKDNHPNNSYIIHPDPTHFSEIFLLNPESDVEEEKTYALDAFDTEEA